MDLQRLAVLYRRHIDFVRRVMLRCGVAEADLDDAGHEAFLVVFHRLDDFEGRSSLRTWLYAIAVRVASSWKRSRRREEARIEKAGAGVHGTGAVDPEAEVSRSDAARILEALLGELDDKKRTVFVLAELEGVKAAEISRILGVNVRTVHSRLRLARQSFDAAVARYHAREAGRITRAALRHAAPPPVDRKRAWAALAAAIDRGAAPTIAAWKTIALGPAPAFVAPLLTTLAVGSAALVAVAFATPAEGEPSPESGAAATSVTGAPPNSADGDAAEEGGAATKTAGPRTKTLQADAPSAAPAAVAAPRAGLPPAGSSALRAAAIPMSETTRASAKKAEPSPPPTDPTDPTLGRPSAPVQSPTARSGVIEETRLLERARAALRRGETATALAALDEHKRRFAAGVLANERRSTRLKALCIAGRAQQATRVAKSFGSGTWLEVVAAHCSAQ